MRATRIAAPVLQAELEKAGALVLLGAIERWTAAQRIEAWEWAVKQIAATAAAKPGTSVSVRWPAHVSKAQQFDHRRRRVSKGRR